MLEVSHQSRIVVVNLDDDEADHDPVIEGVIHLQDPDHAIVAGDQGNPF
jgi:hypothetical protein